MDRIAFPIMPFVDGGPILGLTTLQAPVNTLTADAVRLVIGVETPAASGAMAGLMYGLSPAAGVAPFAGLTLPIDSAGVQDSGWVALDTEYQHNDAWLSLFVDGNDGATHYLFSFAHVMVR